MVMTSRAIHDYKVEQNKGEFFSLQNDISASDIRRRLGEPLEPDRSLGLPKPSENVRALKKIYLLTQYI